MFRRRPDAPAATIAVTVEGRAVVVPEGASAAAAVLASGLASIRDTAKSGSEQEAPGGQIYRGVERADDDSPLGGDYLAGRALVAALRASTARYQPATTVWHIAPAGELSLLANGKSETVAARHILVATGAL